MESDHQAWVLTALLFVVLIVALTMASFAYYGKKNQIVLEALKTGADPIYIEVLFNRR